MSFEQQHRFVREVIETLVLIGIMMLTTHTAIQNFRIDGMSMEPNLHDQELVLVDKWSYHIHSPVRGDIIVFHAPPSPKHDYVKRIIGLPGDIVTIRGTRVFVNGVELHESYVDPQRQGNPYPPIERRLIPPNTYFVLGDNRSGSSDSRDWGCVPESAIIGRATLVYWPWGQQNSGLLPSVASAFAHIPTTPGNLKPASRCLVASPTGNLPLGSPTPDYPPR